MRRAVSGEDTTASSSRWVHKSTGGWIQRARISKGNMRPEKRSKMERALGKYPRTKETRTGDVRWSRARGTNMQVLGNLRLRFARWRICPLGKDWQAPLRKVDKRWRTSCFPSMHAGEQNEECNVHRTVLVRAPHGGCVDTGLRRGRRKPRATSAAPSSPHNYGQRFAAIRDGATGNDSALYGHGDQHLKHKCRLDRQRNRRRKQRRGDGQRRRCVHRAANSACGGHRHCYGN